MPVRPDDPRLDQVGFVKLEGQGVEFYAKKYEIIIGRRSKSTQLDVVLGDNMNISRQHAIIFYNFEHGKWELNVLGKNGVTVDEKICLPGEEQPVFLQSGSFLQMGDRSFYFLLPIEEDQLEWGYASDGVPTVGPSRPALPPRGGAGDDGGGARTGSGDEMDVDGVSNMSSGMRGPSSSRGPPWGGPTSKGVDDVELSE